MKEVDTKICVLSGRYPESEFSANINHKIYCDINNYTYIYCNWPTRTLNRYMNKIEYIRHYYNLFNYIFWIDDDAFFINMDKKLDEFIPKNEDFLSICKSPDFKEIHTFISSGQFMLKCSETGKSFIDQVLTVDLERVKEWWNDSLGYFSNGDQDAMTFLLKTHLEYKNHFKLFHHSKFNSRVEEILEHDVFDKIFILHITGTVTQKKKDYILIQKHLNRSPILVDRSLESLYNISVKPPSMLHRLFTYFRTILT